MGTVFLVIPLRVVVVRVERSILGMTWINNDDVESATLDEDVAYWWVVIIKYILFGGKKHCFFIFHLTYLEI